MNVAWTSQSQANGPVTEYWKAPGDACLMLSMKTAPSAIWIASVTKPTTRLVRAAQWKYRRFTGWRLAAA